MTDGSTERSRRAEYRAFVRENHPDVGGDAEAFAAGLAAFRRGEHAAGRSGEQPDTGRHDTGASTKDPYDAPIEIVRTGRAVARVNRWWRRATGPPRVH